MSDEESTASLEDVIGIGPGSVAEETLSPDERDALEEARETEQAPAPASQPEAPSEDSANQDAAPSAAEGAGTDGADEVPEGIAPEQATNWQELRTAAKDFRSQAKEARETLAARDAQLATMQAEIAALKAQTQAQQPQAPPQPAPQLADPLENPQAFREQVLEEASMVATMAKFDQSEQLAIVQHGKDKTEQALAAFKVASASDPALKAMVNQSPHPWGTIIQEMDRRTMLAEIGDDPAAYRAKVEAEALEKAKAELAGQTEAEKTAAIEAALSTRDSIPSSIATAPGSGQNATANAGTYTGPQPLTSAWDSPLDR